MKLLILVALTLAPTLALCNDSQLIGAWKTPCLVVQPEGNGSSRLSMAFRADGTATTELVVFESSDCSGLPVVDVLQYGFYSIPGNGKFDFVANELRLAMYDVQAVDNANSVVLCGASDWKAGQLKSVRPQNCDAAISSNANMYSIYAVRGDKLYLGSTSNGFDGTTPQTRPLRLDESAYLLRSE